MKKNFFPLLLSVITGVAIGLTITLRLWGPEWYKVIAAIFAGILGGLFGDCPKEFMNMAKQAFRQSFHILSQIPYAGKKVQVILTRKIPNAKTFLARLLLHFSLLVAKLAVFLAIFALFAASLYYYSGFLNYFIHFSPEKSTFLFTLITLSVAVPGFALIFATLHSFDSYMWYTALSPKKTERIWKGKWSWNLRYEGYISDDFVSKYFWSNIYKCCSYREIFIGVMKTITTIYFRALWRFAKIVFGLVIFLPIWILLLVFDFILMLGSLLHIAAANRFRLLMMISIALGIVFGTVFFSSLLGFAIGSISVIIGYLAGKYLPDDMPGLLDRFNKIKPVYSIRKRLFIGLFSA